MIEQVAGGQTARALIGDTLHFAKGVDHLQPLHRLAQAGNLPSQAARRLLEEAHKIEEAVAWASRYSKAVAAGTATLDDLPAWAQGYRRIAEAADLRAMLVSADPAQRRNALLLAGFTGDPALLPDVETATRDPEPRVRAEAERLLCWLAG